MGDAPAAQTESNVELGVNAYIPGSYIPEEEQKLDIPALLDEAFASIEKIEL